MRETGQQKRRNSNSAPADTKAGAPKGTAQPKVPRKTWLWFVLILLVNFLLGRLFMPGPEAPVTVPYTLFKEEVGNGNVHKIFSRGETITRRFKSQVIYPLADKRVRHRLESPRLRASAM